MYNKYTQFTGGHMLLKVENLCKTYPAFQLKNISFELHEGFITGFIGKNGAGKTTTIKSILDYVHPDGGNVEMFDMKMSDNEVAIKQQVGVLLGELDYYPKTKIKRISDIQRRFFSNWDENIYRDYLEKFNIDENKLLCQLSSGMRVKLGLAFALSHNAKLLILDEPTSGLDPIARDELLHIFRNIVSDENTGIIYSTHITSDLDKCADYILYISNGSLIANTTKDDLIEEHRLVGGTLSQLTEDLQRRAIGIQKNAFGFSALVKTADLLPSDNTLQIAGPNLEDIMIYYDLEEKHNA